MTAIPLLQGMLANEQSSFRTSLPINYEPVALETGLSKGYLRASPGIRTFSTTVYGSDRGSIVTNGNHFRVFGNSFVQVMPNGTIKLVSSIADDGKPVTFDSSFDLLGIASGGYLYYWDGAKLTQVTDTDLGNVVDMMWLDGRFITTDGSYIVLTELNDPYSVDPLKYGSAEVSPDPIVGICHIRGEMYALGTATIENYRNVGGSGFPYQRNSGALIPKGCVGTKAFSYFLDTFAFVGGAPGEKPSVWLAGGGEALPLGNEEVDRRLAQLSAADLASLEMECRQGDGEQRLLVHLPTQTLVYHYQTSKAQGQPIWGVIAGGVEGNQAYPIRHLSLWNGQWYGGDTTGRIGVLDYTLETQFGSDAGWQFDTLLIYNDGAGGILHSVELLGLTGRVPFGSQPHAFFSTTMDGETFSQERSIETGRFGERGKRVQWRPHRKFDTYMGMRFRGSGNGRSSWASCQATIEPLSA